MDYCHVEFRPLDSESLKRTEEVFALMRAMKKGDIPLDEEQLTSLLSPRERSYFWSPTPEQLAEWNKHWAATPVAVRTSAAMVCPQWDLGSMYEAIWDGEYELVDIVQEGLRYFLAINPEAYPYGGISCFVALLESFGHKAIGYDDGTGYVEHVPREVWRPRASG
jgi:hypothetical protein